MNPRARTVRRKVPLHRLREHPAIHWPPGIEPNPPWAGPNPRVPDPLHVVLTKVELVQPDKHAARHLTLSGTYEGNPYRTTLTLEDPSLANNLYKSLMKCIGETIAGVGSREVDPFLNLA